MPGAVYKNSNRGKGAENSNKPPQAKVAPEAGSGNPNTAKKTATTPPPRPKALSRSDARPDTSSKTIIASAEKQSGWMIRLSPSILVMLSMLLLVTLVFFFGFGLIIGKSTLPPVEPTARETFVPPATVADPQSPEIILPEEDLRFMSILRSEGTEGSLLPEELPETVPTSSPESSAQGPATSPHIPAQTPDNVKYDFVLRAAAFRQEEQADNLRLRLEDAGMRTKLIRETGQSGNWFHVQILYRGTTENFQMLRDSLSEYNISDTILASKTPVS